jgi:hypothetical protein
MSKRVEEEFNPWPSFVDIFSSVILVLLLFLLILIVNVTYYLQFRHKISYVGVVQNPQVIKKREIPQKKEETKSKDNEKFVAKRVGRKKEQKVYEKDKELIVAFDMGDVFLSKDSKELINGFLQKAKSKYGAEKIYLSTTPPLKAKSKTKARQVSLGRMLNIKNIVTSAGYGKKDMALDLLKKADKTREYGSVIIRIGK